MPVVSAVAYWPSARAELYELGLRRVREFCRANSLPVPATAAFAKDEWKFGVCAYYHPDTPAAREWTRPGISICLEHCSGLCGETPSRHWTWPGSTTDREPFGVVCHELGHHADYLTGDKKGSYFSDYGPRLMELSGEPAVSSYGDENPAEWFAEAFRLFAANPGLLRQLRPKTFKLISEKFTPVGTLDWLKALGSNVPARVVRTLRNKGAR